MIQQENKSLNGHKVDGRYINFELSLLDFHLRVLQQAIDPVHPLLERLNFLIIFSRNLDEFFEVHVARLVKHHSDQQSHNHRQQYKGTQDKGTQENELSNRVVLTQINNTVHAAVAQQSRILNQQILPLLAQHNIRVLSQNELSDEQLIWARQYFKQQVLAKLNPVFIDIKLDKSNPVFLALPNKALNIIVALQPTALNIDLSNQSEIWSIVTVPYELDQLILIPSIDNQNIASQSQQYIQLTTIIQANIDDLFEGYRVVHHSIFRVTYNALNTTEACIDKPVVKYHGDKAIRLEIESNSAKFVRDYLLNTLDLDPSQLYCVDGILDLTQLSCLYNKFDLKQPALKYLPHKPNIPPVLQPSKDIFAAIRQRDILLHHPFDSFEPIINLLKVAAHDPQVVAIKQTLYRVGANSEVVQQLINAAHHGKQVTVIIELRVRSDEANNIVIAKELQISGAKVIYTSKGYKIHAKMLLITRRERDIKIQSHAKTDFKYNQQKLVNYVHLGTGNYHVVNTQLYTDFGLLSADNTLTKDVEKVFHSLINSKPVEPLEKLLLAPFNLHDALLSFIEHEIKQAQKGQPAHIIIKANALTEHQLIDALYRASQYGVKVDLIIRSICCLRPQVAGLSDNIYVRSIVGRFLEHTRVFYFANSNAQPRLYCASADWMDRNMFSRIEVAFPIKDSQLKQRIIQQGLLWYLQDNQQAWVLDGDGKWQRMVAGKNEALHMAQQMLL